MRPLILVALAALLTASAHAGVIRDRIYPAPTEPLSLAGLPEQAMLSRVVTADGLSLTGIELPGRADRPVLLVFHGNASDADGTIAWLRPLVERGYGVVAAEYRGYSGNPGRPSEHGLAADADAFLARARILAGTRPIIVVGHSLGAGVGFGLAGRQSVAALVTIGAFTGMRPMAPRIARAFINDRYDNVAAVPMLTMPLFLIHGAADQVVPSGMGNVLRKTAMAAHRRGGALLLAGVDHRPAGELIGQTMDAIVVKLEKPETPFPALPDVTFYPFD